MNGSLRRTVKTAKTCFLSVLYVTILFIIQDEFNQCNKKVEIVFQTEMGYFLANSPAMNRSRISA